MRLAHPRKFQDALPQVKRLAWGSRRTVTFCTMSFSTWKLELTSFIAATTDALTRALELATSGKTVGAFAINGSASDLETQSPDLTPRSQGNPGSTAGLPVSVPIQ
jgi:hypothetical protein